MSRPHTIDVHAHFLPPVYREALRSAGLKSVDGGMPIPNWSPERALDLMDEVGITAALLSVSSPHVSFVEGAEAAALCRSVNDEAAELRDRHPERFGAFAILPLPDVATSLLELDRALDELELDGVALPTHAAGRYLGDKQFAPVLERLDDRGVAVFVHPTSPCCFEAFGLELPAPMIEFPFDTTRTVASLLYEGALARHPGIDFILPHAGGTLPFLAPRIAAIGSAPALGERAVPLPDAMQAFARLHYDTALSATPQQITALRSLVPLSQILYGTDYPFAPDPLVRLADGAIAALFEAEEQAQIRCGNPSRLFGGLAQRAGCVVSEEVHMGPVT